MVLQGGRWCVAQRASIRPNDKRAAADHAENCRNFAETSLKKFPRPSGQFRVFRGCFFDDERTHDLDSSASLHGRAQPSSLVCSSEAPQGSLVRIRPGHQLRGGVSHSPRSQKERSLPTRELKSKGWMPAWSHLQGGPLGIHQPRGAIRWMLEQYPCCSARRSSGGLSSPATGGFTVGSIPEIPR